MISLITAFGSNKVIGKNGGLPWYIPEDFKWFKQHTKGKIVVMGRKTYESIGKPLPYRTNVIMSNSMPLYYDEPQGYSVTRSVDDVLKRWGHCHEVVFIGGAGIYKLAIPIVSRMYITQIYHDFDGDTFFPEYNENEWEPEQIVNSENDQYKYDFKILKRRQ